MYHLEIPPAVIFTVCIAVSSFCVNRIRTAILETHRFIESGYHNVKEDNMTVDEINGLIEQVRIIHKDTAIQVICNAIIIGIMIVFTLGVSFNLIIGG